VGLPSLAVAESPGFAAASVGEDTGVAVSVPAAVRENFRCISGRGCTVLST
jgi:hypothetical protein